MSLEAKLFVFLLSTFLGLEVIRRVSPLLHTPLMSLTNAISAIAIVITAAYLLIAIQRVFFGEIPAELDHHVGDVTVLDKVAITVLSVAIIGVGVFPFLMAPQVSTAVQAVLKMVLGGA